VFLKSGNHALSPELMEELHYALAHHRHSTFAVVAAAGDDEHLGGAVHLRLTKPGLGARNGGRSSGQRFAKVERSAAAEADFVEGLSQAAQPTPGFTFHAR